MQSDTASDDDNYCGHNRDADDRAVVWDDESDGAYSGGRRDRDIVRNGCRSRNLPGDDNNYDDTFGSCSTRNCNCNNRNYKDSNYRPLQSSAWEGEAEVSAR